MRYLTTFIILVAFLTQDTLLYSDTLRPMSRDNQPTMKAIPQEKWDRIIKLSRSSDACKREGRTEEAEKLLDDIYNILLECPEAGNTEIQFISLAKRYKALGRSILDSTARKEMGQGKRKRIRRKVAALYQKAYKASYEVVRRYSDLIKAHRRKPYIIEDALNECESAIRRSLFDLVFPLIKAVEKAELLNKIEREVAILDMEEMIDSLHDRIDELIAKFPDLEKALESKEVPPLECLLEKIPRIIKGSAKLARVVILTSKDLDPEKRKQARKIAQKITGKAYDAAEKILKKFSNLEAAQNEIPAVQGVLNGVEYLISNFNCIERGVILDPQYMDTAGKKVAYARAEDLINKAYKMYRKYSYMKNVARQGYYVKNNYRYLAFLIKDDKDLNEAEQQETVQRLFYKADMIIPGRQINLRRQTSFYASPKYANPLKSQQGVALVNQAA